MTTTASKTVKISMLTTLVAMTMMLSLSLSSSWSVVEAKKCRTMSRGKKLKELVSKSNVLVALQYRQPGSSGDDDDDDSDDVKKKGDKTFQELCDRLEATPPHNSQDIDVVLVTDSNLKKKVWESSTASYLSPKASYVTQFLFKTGLSRLLFKNPSPGQDVMDPPVYVLYKQGDEPLTGRGLRMTEPLVESVADIVVKNRPPSDEDESDDDDDDTKLAKANADLVSDFLATQLNRKKLGNYVYSLGAYDIMAYDVSEGMLKMDGSPTLPAIVWIKVIAPTLYYVLYPSAAPYEQEIAQEYIKIGQKLLKDKTYVDSQVKRLESMLTDTSENKMSSKQQEKLSQRLHILRRYQNPTTSYTKSVIRGFLLRLVLNVLTLGSVVLMLPYLFAYGQEEEPVEQEQQEAEKEEEDDEDKDEDYNEDDHKEEDLPLEEVEHDEDEYEEIDAKNILDSTKKRPKTSKADS